jgi:hypothetical protein
VSYRVGFHQNLGQKISDFMLRNLLICGSTAMLSLSHSDEQYSLMLEALIRKRKGLR